MSAYMCLGGRVVLGCQDLGTYTFFLGQTPKGAQAMVCPVNDLAQVPLPLLGPLVNRHQLPASHTCIRADTTCPRTAPSLRPKHSSTDTHSHTVTHSPQLILIYPPTPFIHAFTYSFNKCLLSTCNGPAALSTSSSPPKTE